MKKLKQKISDPIPVDVLIEIFSRVPAESIARFRCVSKFWSTILVRPDFTELFLTRSSSRPRLLFTFEVNGELFFYSSSQPQNPDKNLSLLATPYKNFPTCIPTDICNLLCERGLVFLQNRERKVRVICNPATGESVTLPKVRATGDDYSCLCYCDQSCLGYDPINKQFKVLCMTSCSRYNKPYTHRVLTLEAGKLSWRMIQDPVFSHFYTCMLSWECINGVLYYGADNVDSQFRSSTIIACFDFRSEKLSFINIDKDMLYEIYEGRFDWTLFNYKGKLGAYRSQYRGEKELVLWVLQDAGKHEWSKIICVMPPLSREILNYHKIVRMTSTGEFVFSPCFLSNPFYLYFYNIERNTFTRVNIQGLVEIKQDFVIIRTFLDYVETMKFM